eukprot:PhF_6_TR4856/c0_g1_i3/m.6803
MTDTNFRSLSRNCYLVWCFVLFNGLGSSIWSGAILTVYIYNRADHSNTMVGFLAGLIGLAEMVVALFCGVGVDKFARRPFIRAAVCCGIAAGGTMIYAVHWSSTELTFMYVTLALWGATTGLWNPAVESLYADSVTSGDRTAVYTVKYAVEVLSNILGPIVAIVLFQVYGDTWSTDLLGNIMLLGVLVNTVGFAPMLWMSDEFSLGKESEGLLAEQNEDDKNRTMLVPSTKYVPYFIATSDVIFSVASGVTVKFFALFFKTKYGLSPVTINTVTIGCTVLIAVIAALLQVITKKIQTDRVIYGARESSGSVFVGIYGSSTRR